MEEDKLTKRKKGVKIALEHVGIWTVDLIALVALRKPEIPMKTAAVLAVIWSLIAVVRYCLYRREKKNVLNRGCKSRKNV